jgi:hypothetical protein
MKMKLKRLRLKFVKFRDKKDTRWDNPEENEYRLVYHTWTAVRTSLDTFWIIQYDTNRRTTNKQNGLLRARSQVSVDIILLGESVRTN